MAALFRHDDAMIRHPVHLNGTARSFEWFMAVPGIVGATEDEKGAAKGGHFFHEIFQVRFVF